MCTCLAHLAHVFLQINYLSPVEMDETPLKNWFKDDLESLTINIEEQNKKSKPVQPVVYRQHLQNLEFGRALNA